MKIMYFFHATDIPYSTDPFKYDPFIHHITFRSVLSPLISQYKVGVTQGVLAESWNSESPYTTWTFKLRKGLKFESGDEITPLIIQKSLKRIFFLQKKYQSRSGIAEHIEGIEKFNDLSLNWPTIVELGKKNFNLNKTF